MWVALFELGFLVVPQEVYRTEVSRTNRFKKFLTVGAGSAIVYKRLLRGCDEKIRVKSLIFAGNESRLEGSEKVENVLLEMTSIAESCVDVARGREKSDVKQEIELVGHI